MVTFERQNWKKNTKATCKSNNMALFASLSQHDYTTGHIHRVLPCKHEPWTIGVWSPGPLLYLSQEKAERKTQGQQPLGATVRDGQVLSAEAELTGGAATLSSCQAACHHQASYVTTELLSCPHCPLTPAFLTPNQLYPPFKWFKLISGALC